MNSPELMIQNKNDTTNDIEMLKLIYAGPPKQRSTKEILFL